MIYEDVRGRALDRLSAAFNRPPSKAVHDAYKEALAGLSDDEFLWAADKALTSCDRWPVPKVLLHFALEERGRIRHAFTVRGESGDLPACEGCGAVPQWHQYYVLPLAARRLPLAQQNGKDILVERYVVRHGEGRQCERLNAGRVFV